MIGCIIFAIGFSLLILFNLIRTVRVAHVLPPLSVLRQPSQDHDEAQYEATHAATLLPSQRANTSDKVMTKK